MLDPDQITVGANGRVYVAPVGTVAPASISATPAGDWIHLGYTSEDGVTFLDGKTVEPIPVWQSFYPVRRIMTGKEASVSFALMQWNTDTVRLSFGGGTVTEPAPGEYRYTPPTPGPIDERALMVEWEDGDRSYRLVVPRGMVSENVETQLNKGAAGQLPIVFAVNGSDVAAPWYLDTDDPAFVPTGSS